MSWFGGVEEMMIKIISKYVLLILVLVIFINGWEM